MNKQEVERKMAEMILSAYRPDYVKKYYVDFDMMCKAGRMVRRAERRRKLERELNLGLAMIVFIALFLAGVLVWHGVVNGF